MGARCLFSTASTCTSSAGGVQGACGPVEYTSRQPSSPPGACKSRRSWASSGPVEYTCRQPSSPPGACKSLRSWASSDSEPVEYTFCQPPSPPGASNSSTVVVVFAKSRCSGTGRFAAGQVPETTKSTTTRRIKQRREPSKEGVATTPYQIQYREHIRQKRALGRRPSQNGYGS